MADKPGPVTTEGKYGVTKSIVDAMVVGFSLPILDNNLYLN